MGRATQLIIAITVSFLILFGLLAAAAYSQYGDNQTAQAEIGRLRQELAGYEAKIATRERRLELKAAIDEANREVIQLLPRFSEATSADKALEQLNRYRSKARLELSSTKPEEPRLAKAEFGDHVMQTSFNMTLEGTFSAVLKFIGLVERSPNLLRVEELKLNPTGENEGGVPVLRVFVKISAFHYKV